METHNPFSPSADDGRLTRKQIAYLHELKRMRENPSLAGLLLVNWRIHLTDLCVFLLTISPLLFIRMPMKYATFIMGFALAYAAVNLGVAIGTCVLRLRIWPAQKRIIDWIEVDRLLSESAHSNG